MIELNNSVFYFFNQLAGQSPLGDWTIIFFAKYLAYLLIIAFLVWLTFRKTSLREKILIAISALTATILARVFLVETIRFFYQHPRPFATLSGVTALFPETGYSFPSGHASFFFALSAVIYCHNKKLGAAFFCFSAIMGVARIIAGAHYPFDILAGAIFGSFIGFATCKTLTLHYRKRSNISSESSQNISDGVK